VRGAKAFEDARKLAAVGEGRAMLGACEQTTLVVKQPLCDVLDRQAGMRLEPVAFACPSQNEGRSIQAHIDALRTILEEPVTARVVIIIAVDEGNDLRTGDGFARAALQ